MTLRSPHNVLLWNEWGMTYVALGDEAQARASTRVPGPERGLCSYLLIWVMLLVPRASGPRRRRPMNKRWHSTGTPLPDIVL